VTGDGLMAIALRPATPADSEFCFRLHKAAMGAYVAAVWGWDERIQRDFHARAFAPDRWQIITVDGVDAGMLHVEQRPTEIYLARIEVHPDHQGSGIASRLIRGLLRQARRQGRDLTLDVLVVNRRAQALYRRLGLQEVARHGEDDIKIRMSTGPPQPDPVRGA
jgi:ribosomal protein S18 acetylase RimI-like enzyme